MKLRPGYHKPFVSMQTYAQKQFYLGQVIQQQQNWLDEQTIIWMIA